MNTGKFVAARCTGSKNKIVRKISIIDGYEVLPCSRCKRNLPLENFAKDGRAVFGYASYCRECYASYNRENSKRRTGYRLRKLYGIDRETYDKLYRNQGGECWICRKACEAINTSRSNANVLVVDHCHITGKVRGLLCGSCNRGLGFLRDDIDILYSAIRYLEAQEGISEGLDT